MRGNQNITKEEAAILRKIAAKHNYTASSGPYAGQGSQLQLLLGIVSGEVATVLLPDEHQYPLRRWLAAGIPATALDDGTEPTLRDALAEVLKQALDTSPEDD